MEIISFQGGLGSHLTKKSLSSVLTEIKAYLTLEKVSEEVGETLATSHNFTAVTATPLETVPEEVGETLAAVCEETADTVDSPLQFRHCPRGPGRPKTKRFGPPSLTSTKRKCNDDGDEEIESSQRPASKKQHVETTEKPKRGRPRPKGS